MKQQRPIGPVSAWMLASTLFAVATVAPSAWASSELFPSTEVTVRYEPFEWLAEKYSELKAKRAAKAEQATVAAVAVPPSPSADIAAVNFDTIEPAAGHGEPSATGKSEGQKSHAGKTLTASPGLPSVTIGGKQVVSYADSVAKDVAETTPEALKGSAITSYLARRFNVTPYVHSPTRGPRTAKIKVLEFVDLSCGQCMPELAKIDAVMADYADTAYITSIHAPTARFQDTNMQAFYGKIAARGNVYWPYRANLIARNPQDANAIFDELIKSGMSLTDARSLMLTDARRFYREMDADALLARSFGVGKPPILFINGIRVGDGGIPLEKLSDIMQYVSDRIQRGLVEPPQ